MKILRWISRKLQPSMMAELTVALNDQKVQIESRLREDFRNELRIVGLAISEIQTQVSHLTTQSSKSIQLINERLQLVERFLAVSSQPVRPGNHITLDHEFGNKVRL